MGQAGIDRWRQLGNVGWAWDDVMPLFCRSENWEGPESPVRGKGGSLNVSESRLKRPVVDAWVEAAVGLGYRRNDDYNGEDQEGVGHFQMTMRNGRRCSSAAAFLKPALKRPNLHVFTGAQTEGLILEAKRAVGIRFRRGDQTVEARARHEVVLSAGALGSPHLLMLSGIGAGDDLRQQGSSLLPIHPASGKISGTIFRRVRSSRQREPRSTAKRDTRFNMSVSQCNTLRRSGRWRWRRALVGLPEDET